MKKLPLKKPTKAKLFKTFDEVRRKYIRLRDGDWKFEADCISCGVHRLVEELQVGHYYGRTSDFTTPLGGMEENVNLQCVPCNGVRRGNPQGYAVGLVNKYGSGIICALDIKKKEKKYWKYSEIEELIKVYQTKINQLE